MQCPRWDLSWDLSHCEPPLYQLQLKEISTIIVCRGDYEPTTVPINLGREVYLKYMLFRKRSVPEVHVTWEEKCTWSTCYLGREVYLKYMLFRKRSVPEVHVTWEEKCIWNTCYLGREVYLKYMLFRKRSVPEVHVT